MLTRSISILLCSLPFSWVLGEDFTVNAEIYCTTHIATVTLVDGSTTTVFDSTINTSNVTIVPCAGIRVIAFDSDIGPDTTCGVGFTDSQGLVSIDASCSDIVGQPDVYIGVEPRSELGFAVAIWELDNALIPRPGAESAPSPIGFIAANDEYIAVNDQQLHPSEGDALDFTPVLFGNPTSGRADRQYTAATLYDLTLRTMLLVRDATGELPLTPDTRWVVDSVTGFPTTLWDRIVISENLRTNSTAMLYNNIVHELGHNFHNKFHSGSSHWWVADAWRYAHPHAGCTDINQRFGWYEGFAEHFKNAVLAGLGSIEDVGQVPGNMAYRTTHRIRISDCGSANARQEQNTTDALNELHFGNILTRDNPTPGVFEYSGIHHHSLPPSTRDTVCILPNGRRPITVSQPFNMSQSFSIIALTQDLYQAGVISGRHVAADYKAAMELSQICNMFDGSIAGQSFPYCRSDIFKLSTTGNLGFPLIDVPSPSQCTNWGLAGTIAPRSVERIVDIVTTGTLDRDALEGERAATLFTPNEVMIAALKAKIAAEKLRRVSRRPKKSGLLDQGYAKNMDIIEFGASNERTALNIEVLPALRNPSKHKHSPAITQRFETMYRMRHGSNIDENSLKDLLNSYNANISTLNRILKEDKELRLAWNEGRKDEAQRRELELVLLNAGYNMPLQEDEKIDQVSLSAAQEDVAIRWLRLAGILE